MGTEALIGSILAITVRAGTSLVYATIGEILTERVGILNLGVEGLMIMGAVTAFATAFHTESVWAGVGVAMLVGGALAAIHAILSVDLQAGQVVSGLALTLFGTGLANFLGQKLGPGGAPLVGLIGPKFNKVALPGLSQIPIGGALFAQDALVYVMYLFVPAVWIFLFKLRPGLHLRAIGEDPQAAEAMGVNVRLLRYIYTIIGGMLIGLGGAHLSLAYTPGWTEGLTAGRGWIAIALVIFSTWDPVRAVVGSILFGGINAVQFRLQAAGTPIMPKELSDSLIAASPDIAKQVVAFFNSSAFLGMLPYMGTILMLTLITWREAISKRVGAPAALGLPYSREER